MKYAKLECEDQRVGVEHCLAEGELRVEQFGLSVASGVPSWAEHVSEAARTTSQKKNDCLPVKIR